MKKTIAIIFSVVVLLAIYKMQHIKPVDDPKDSPLFSQRLQSSLDRFQENDFPAMQDKMQDRGNLGKRSLPRPPARTKDLVVTGRCGRVTLTWVEEKKIEKESIKIKRKTQNEEYSLLKGKMIYEREEEGGGIRYWTADNGLKDGVTYEYLISFKDSKGQDMVKEPVSINLTCNQRDKEILAQREKMIKEYYQKRGIKEKNYPVMRPPSYQLSKEVHKINLGNSPRKGKQDAPVTLVVFTDFECLHCSTWAETLDTVLKTFPKDVRIVFKNFPLSYHKHSEIAAMAALAAGEQGKFWEMHDMLFKNYNALGKEDITGYVKALGLNLSKFEKSLENKEIKEIIDQDIAQGKGLRVQNTPTTFVNGRSLVGSPPASYIKGVIEDILGVAS